MYFNSLFHQIRDTINIILTRSGVALHISTEKEKEKQEERAAQPWRG